MTRVHAAAVGMLTLAVSLTAVPSATAGPGGDGELVVSPGSVRPGAWVGLSTVNAEVDDDNATVKSKAFTGTVKLKNTGKVMWAGRAKIRCDAEPGTYTVNFTEFVPPGDDFGTKVKVEAGGPLDGSDCADETDGDDSGSSGTTVGLATGAVLVAAGVFFVVRRRSGGRA
ncbi:hypothetical protein [Streptomyces aureoverticillatus]|uniref:hypothetical protein n=1 Tax=Streptomyces aureoverticillatus TaxID=66871 RepID=UPI0013DA04B7|nr:hypothetical protein [Streptomyces aureoverticillatus]QIB44304.1 hypothetical protein G3H79_15630 [Streptomyces aureoverticillatus]